MSIFEVGGYFPPEGHLERVERYRKNKIIAKGEHHKIFNTSGLRPEDQHAVFIAVNLPGTITKKSADYLFGETPTFSAGKEDDSAEQKALERLISDNNLNTLNSRSAFSNAYRGDSFYKIRWGQEYGGYLSESEDPFRVFIESQKAEYVFPETFPGDDTKIFAYHIAYPTPVEGTGDEEWVLNVESHYPGKIEYSKYEINPLKHSQYLNEVIEWRILKELPSARREVNTGVKYPLVVHVPNYATDDDWQGIDDISENESVFAEIDNRLSRIAEILDKHSDPMLAVPAGLLAEDANGEPYFKTGSTKVIEVNDKGEIIPQYITWNGQLEAAFKELKTLTDYLLTVAEIPSVALGHADSGTSGASGLSIKWRMSSLLAKINRKRQYYEKGLKDVLLIAQLLEHTKLSKDALGYEVTTPKIEFKDGLPDDEKETAVIAQLRTGGKPIQSQISAIMEARGLTEEQAKKEVERIREDEKESDGFVDSSIFNSSEELEESDDE
jgi:hypothetical protein